MITNLRTWDRLLFVLYFFGDLLEDDPNPLGLFSSSYKSLFTFQAEKKHQTNFRQSIYRMIRRGYVDKKKIGNERYLRLTSYGKSRLLSSYPNLRYRNRIEWDGYWRMVSFDVSESYRKVRNIIRTTLKSFGYVCFQQSLYISPFGNEADLNSYLLGTSLNKYVKIFLVKSFESDKVIAQDLWKITEVGNLYCKALEEYRKEGNIRVLRNKFLEVASVDPFLPLAVLPNDWPGQIVEKKVLTPFKPNNI